MGYFDHKATMTERAYEHMIEMRKSYHKETQESYKKATIFGSENFDISLNKVSDMPKSKIHIDNIDSVNAIIKYSESNPSSKMAVLNFASNNTPGGKFLEGSSAQEECLCHVSNLYNVLNLFDDSYYNWNRKHKNKSLYENRALYTPNIIFCNDLKCDVITCAAPNRGAAQHYHSVTDIENYKALKSRIDFVLKVAYCQNVKTLILGAFGCGVFKQDPYDVAKIFKELLNTYDYCFDLVVFAVPKALNEVNYIAFEEMFGG